MGVAGLSGHAHASQALDGGAPIIWSRRRSATARWQAPAARLPPGGPTVAPHARRVASGSGELEATPPCGKKDPNTLRPSRSVHSGGQCFQENKRGRTVAQTAISGSTIHSETATFPSGLNKQYRQIAHNQQGASWASEVRGPATGPRLCAILTRSRLLPQSSRIYRMYMNRCGTFGGAPQQTSTIEHARPVAGRPKPEEIARTIVVDPSADAPRCGTRVVAAD
jgi:hypothetical protein